MEYAGHLSLERFGFWLAFSHGLAEKLQTYTYVGVGGTWVFADCIVWRGELSI